MLVYTLYKQMQVIRHEAINPYGKKLFFSRMMKKFDHLFYKMIIFHKEAFLPVCANRNKITIISAIVKILETRFRFVFYHVR